jgi:hypothetical protein
MGMKLIDVWTALPPEGKHALAAAADTTYIYMSQCAGGHRKPSVRLCRSLVAADPRLTLEELRPDIWGERVSA